MLDQKNAQSANVPKEKSVVTKEKKNVEVVAPKEVVKRDGRKVEFDVKRIENAIFRCFRSVDKSEEKSQKLASELADQVYNIVCAKFEVPTVENIQDIVETVLQAAKEFDAAKKYILYRAEHAKMRMERPVPEEVKAAFDKSDEYFPTQLQKFQFYDKYARFNWDLGRRETWVETVDRAVNFLKELSEFRLPKSVYERIRNGILEMKIMPSMRLLAMAGPAARRNNICLYNCSYMPVDSVQSFVEAMIISMSGCGVGYSVENEYVEKFSRIKRQKDQPPMRIPPKVGLKP